MDKLETQLTEFIELNRGYSYVHIDFVDEKENDYSVNGIFRYDEENDDEEEEDLLIVTKKELKEFLID